jgi:endoglucanase
MEWLLKMQIPAGEPQAGMAFHKLHDRVWSGLPLVPPTEYDNDLNNENDNAGRYVYEPTTQATLNLAATAAQCARIWAEIDPDFAAQCLYAAESAWVAARENDKILAGNTPGDGGGNYDESDNRDEFFWAAAELYITTGEEQYANVIHEQVEGHQLAPGIGGMWWGDTQALGMISLATVPNGLPAEDVASFQSLIIGEADHFLGLIENGGYRVPLAISDYVWGSNSTVMNHAIVMALAYQLTGDAAYLYGVTESMNYLLGTNALAFSFVTGYGEASAQHQHHRFWANQGNYPPPPPGSLAGGPNANPSEDAARNNAIMDSGPAKRYVDMIESYSTNEVAINWNSPLMWVAAYLDQQFQE